MEIKPQDWPWSSYKGKDDVLVNTDPLKRMITKNWKKFLSINIQEQEIEILKKCERTGRLLGEDCLIEKIKRLLGRDLKPKKQGPKKKDE